jgi:hypothetical protein
MSILELATYGRTNNDRGMTATGFIVCSGQKKTIPLVLEPDLIKYTEINYFVQYQKMLYRALWDLFNTTGIETPGYLIMTNELLHISLI